MELQISACVEQSGDGFQGFRWAQQGWILMMDMVQNQQKSSDQGDLFRVSILTD